MIDAEQIDNWDRDGAQVESLGKLWREVATGPGQLDPDGPQFCTCLKCGLLIPPPHREEPA